MVGKLGRVKVAPLADGRHRVEGPVHQAEGVGHKDWAEAFKGMGAKTP